MKEDLPVEGNGIAVLAAEVVAAPDLPDEDCHQLSDELRILGLDPTTRKTVRHRGVSDILPWLVWIVLPLQVFLNTLVEKLADDAYLRLKALAAMLFRRHGGPAGETRMLILEDRVSGVQVVLEPDLPAECYRQLQKLELSTLPPGPLRYDRTSRKWYSRFDESSPPNAGTH